jgi:hypothetical protein
LIALTLFRAGRGRPLMRRDLSAQAFRRRRAAIPYDAPALSEQRGGSALLDALDDQRTPIAQRMN